MPSSPIAVFTTLVSAVAPPRVSRRVCVIGGGSGGVIAARFLKRAGHKPKLFEAGTTFGGVWADDPTNDVVYKALTTNLPTVVMQSPDLDFEPGMPSYITKPQLGRYIERYAEEFGVVPISTLGARVTRVSQACGDSKESISGPWEVAWTTSDGSTQTDTFDAVVVANGHYEEPFIPTLPGEAEWLQGDPNGRKIVHSREYDEPEQFKGKSVLVVGGRSSGVDIARALRGHAKWVYVLEKGCTEAVTHEGEAVTHVPLGTRLSSDGHLRMEGNEASMPGPPVDQVILATGYVYSFPFLEEAALGMAFKGKRLVTPLYQHLMHVERPSLGFIGIPLAVPCPIPFFECQAAYLAEAWARPDDDDAQQLVSLGERQGWVSKRLSAVSSIGREQDMHLTSADGGNAWSYMRELLHAVHKVHPPTAEGSSWLERPNWEHRLETVESVYKDRGARYPKKPWHDDAYRRCEYEVDWVKGTWSVDDSLAS